MDPGIRAGGDTPVWGWRMKLRVGLAIVVLCVGASGLWAVVQAVQEPFPHSDHAGLFPLCQGCHEGIETDTEVAYYPTSGSCAECHDGEVEPEVDWEMPVVAPSNVVYSHRIHIEDVVASGEEADCATCHRLAPDSVAMLLVAAERDAIGPGAGAGTEAVGAPHMFVGRADPETCVSCHAHEAPEHLSYSQDCSACHQTLAEATALSSDRIAAFPRPAEHDDIDFILNHEELEVPGGTSCATCHTRDSCERCHANAADVDEIVRLRSDSRIAGLLHEVPAEYPEPEDHESASWTWAHAAPALENSGGCANCHTQPTCTSCHNEVSNAQVDAMPVPVAGGARGVEWDGEAPPAHRPDFATTHGAAAATAEAGCVGCHVQETCAACHEGSERPEFHQGNFLEMHGPEAYGAELDCASCHNSEVFCRACHQGVGLASQGGIDIAFHSSNPFWLLGHGVAARQGLEGCTTCHSQVDCTQCHSAVGGWGISPHGPGFDPDRAMSASREGCVACHVGVRE